MATPNATCLRLLGLSRLPPDPSEETDKLLLAHSLNPWLFHILVSAQSESPLTGRVASNRGQTKLCVPEFLCQFHKVVGFLHVRVVDPVVIRAFPQFVLSGGKGPLVAANTEQLIWNRAIRRHVRFVDSSTDQKIQRPHSHEHACFSLTN